jgi:leucyl/phenylalanyl-tRNA--protein transferase
MPVFVLCKEILFPPVDLADESGMIAVGGDLSPARLLSAYKNGIFPWYNEDDPILWWSPDPRFVLFPDEFRISRSLRKVVERGRFRITYDKSFREVMIACGGPRKKRDGTWINKDMIEAYSLIHDMGYAHSVEAWSGDDLSGGLYGVSIGRCFFGESMFTRESDASKAALADLVLRLRSADYNLIDCQIYTDHLYSLGARDIPRDEFIRILNASVCDDEFKFWHKAME